MEDAAAELQLLARDLGLGSRLYGGTGKGKG